MEVINLETGLELLNLVRNSGRILRFFVKS